MQPAPKYRWYPFLTGLFSGLLVLSNIIAVKLIQIEGLVLPAAVVIFPVTYILGDVFTEVYGYALARRVIWTGFFTNLVAVMAIAVALRLPAAPPRGSPARRPRRALRATARPRRWPSPPPDW